ncbi:MAG: hypothetical protein ACL7BU_07840 [Candidatus Phlomobacter fragariae]
MNTPDFTLDDAQKLIIAKFIHEIPFTQLLGLEVLSFDKKQKNLF